MIERILRVLAFTSFGIGFGLMMIYLVTAHRTWLGWSAVAILFSMFFVFLIGLAHL